ncbi:hypothetical protein KJ940_14065, partial [Myxococcota bacterium]|nr:hypothetical protein [Myxococcota bacterium]
MRAALWIITLFFSLTALAEAKQVTITLDDDSVVEGRLIDRLPDGYLLRVGQANRLISYQSVKSLQDQ